MSHESKDTAKKELPRYIEEAFGIISSACKLAGCSRASYWRWCQEDAEFKRLCEEAIRNGEELGLDQAERSLFRNIQDCKESSIFYYLNNKGKARGYSKLNQDNANNTVLNIDLSTLSEEQLDRQIDRLKGNH